MMIVAYSLICITTLEAYIANMYPDQTARVHRVFFHDAKKHEVDLNIYSRRKKQTFSGQKIISKKTDLIRLLLSLSF